MNGKYSLVDKNDNVLFSGKLTSSDEDISYSHEKMFKRGNLVRFKNKERVAYWNTDGAVKEENPYYDKLAIINKISGEYSVCLLDGSNSMAWFDDDEFELVDEGGEYLFEEYEKNKAELDKQYTNINWIKENFSNISSTSMLYLFELIGVDSVFKHNGEYYTLFLEWSLLKNIFEGIFNNDKDAMIKAVNKGIKEKYVTKYMNKCLDLFNQINMPSN